jgi:cytoskeletal protein CcmA (bactofilin family)
MMGIFGKNDSRPSEPVPRQAGPAVGHAAGAAAASAAAGAACVIGPRVQLKGELHGADTVVVEGSVEGTVRLTAELRVAQGGCVKADVTAVSVVVAGEVIGDCHASERVVIEASGRLTGNIKAPRIVIAEGATFRGTSDMSPHAGGGAA